VALLALICLLPPWYHLGRAIVTRLTPKAEPDLRDGLSVAVGFAALGYAVMILALLGLLRPSALWVFVIVPFLATLPLTLRRARGLPHRWRGWASDFPLIPDRILWALIGFLALCDLISCGNAAVGWDAAVYHYGLPKALLSAGRMIDLPAISFSYYPLLGEMLFTLGLGIDREFLAGALTWVYLLPAAAGLLVLGRRLGHARLGLWALVIFLGAPLTLETPFGGVVDLPFFVYCLLAVAVLMNGEQPLAPAEAILAGILIGCACAVKHLGLLFLIAFVPILVWRVWAMSRRLGPAIIAALAVILLSLIIPLPWYLRSYLATGDPAFPFLGNLINLAGATHGSFSIESFARSDYPRTLQGFLSYLWYLTTTYTDKRPWFWAITPAYLAFLPPAIILACVPTADRSRRASLGILRPLLVLAILSLLISFFLAPAYPRYSYPTWLCLSLVSAWILAEIRREWPFLGRVMLPLALLPPLLVVLGMAGKRAIEVIPQYWSPEARIAAVREAFPGYDTFLWADANLDPEHSRILSIDPKVYYLASPTVIATPGIESPLLVPWDSPPSDILANWRDLDVTHFILDTTLLSVKHGFGIDLFTAIMGDRDKVWLDIVTTRAAADIYGIGDILTDEEFLYMSAKGGLPVVPDGTIDRHLLTRERLKMFQSRDRSWLMANKLLRFIKAGILTEEFRSGPAGGLRIYSVHPPDSDNTPLPNLPDVTEWCLPYEDGPI
jgi:hypothetical protein